MATAPRKPLDFPLEFRAPPPSPAAGAHTGELKSSEDDELAGFLNRSLRVPELILPDRIFHRETTPWNPPELDFQSLISSGDDGSAVEILKSTAGSIGCFQLVNHGIPRDLIEEVGIVAGRVFRLPTEKKKEVERSAERRWGFEVEDEMEESKGEEEFFWWCGRRDEEMAGMWAEGYKDFSDRMESLWREMEKIANKIGLILLQNNAPNADSHLAQLAEATDGSVLCLHKHGQSKIHGDGPSSSLKNDILRMVIKSSVCSHSLCLHICRAASRFRVYLKKGCVHFPVKDGAVVVTVGNHIQAWSNGLYKHAIGKPIFEDEENSISIAFLYSHPASIINTASSRSSSSSTTVGDGEKTISLTQQVMIAACLTLLYHIIVYIYGSI